MSFLRRVFKSDSSEIDDHPIFQSRVMQEHLKDLKCKYFTYQLFENLKMCPNSVKIKDTLCPKHQKEKDDFFNPDIEPEDDKPWDCIEVKGTNRKERYGAILQK